MNKRLFTKYFSRNLAKQLRPDNSYLDQWPFNSLTDEHILRANMFISIFEAGDKFEGNYKELGNHQDITEAVLSQFPQMRDMLDYYCKTYDFYRNYSWKILCGGENDIQKRIALVQKFFFWIRDVSKYGYEDIYSDRQLQEDINNGCFSVIPFVEAYLNLAQSDNVVILPQSKRIVRLNGLSTDELLAQRHKPLCEYGGGTAEMDLIDAINQALEEIEDE